MKTILRYGSSSADTIEAALIREVGTGISEARSAEQLIKLCGFKDKEQLDAAVSAAWKHGVRVLQYKGKYFVAANGKEFEYYLARQSTSDGDPVIEYR